MKKKPTQKCIECGHTKPLTEFPRNAGGGRRSVCRAHIPAIAVPAWKITAFAQAAAHRRANREAAKRRAAKARQSGLVLTAGTAEAPL